MSLGDVLRQGRNDARLSIEQLSALTSIRAGLLEQMESNDFSACGGDTYAKGHLRLIASRIGKDPDELIELFDQEHSTAQRRIHDLLQENNATTFTGQKTKLTWKSLVALSLSILVIIGVGQIIISNTKTITPSVKPVATSTPSPEATPSASATSAPSPTAAANGQENILTLSATNGNAVIDVVVDGAHIEKGWLLQGQVKKFTSLGRISIYVSDAGNVEYTFNGSTPALLGQSGQEFRRTYP